MADEKNEGKVVKTDSPSKSDVRTHYVLASGMGTVSAEDYDPKVHGKVVEETDEQFAARLAAKNSGVPKPGVHPPTTIANLQTVDPSQAQAAAAVVLPSPIATPLVGKPVATKEEVEGDKVEKDKDGKPVAPKPGTPKLGADGKPLMGADGKPLTN